MPQLELTSFDFKMICKALLMNANTLRCVGKFDNAILHEALCKELKAFDCLEDKAICFLIALKKPS